MFFNLSNEEVFILIILSILIFAMGLLLGTGLFNNKTPTSKIKEKRDLKTCPRCRRLHERYARHCLSCEDILIGLS